MKKLLSFLLIGLVLLVSILLVVSLTKNKKRDTMSLYMQITSSAFANNTPLPKNYSCDGKGVNPPLTIFETPKNAKSLVVIVDDPDAPKGTFTHWVVYNIDPLTKEIAENSVPVGSSLGKTSIGQQGYVPACPPSGQHRYFFKIFALDILLSVDANADKKAIEMAMKGHILASSQLIGLYSR